MINKLCLFLGTTILLSSLFSLSYASSFAKLAQAETSAPVPAAATAAPAAATAAAAAATAAAMEQSEQTQALATPAPEPNKQQENTQATSKVCLPVMPHEQVPLYIRPQQCYELQGGNVINGDLTVQGKLFIKAGRKVSLTSDNSITVRNGGQFEIRGELDLKERSAINIDHNSSFNCTGLLYMSQGSQFNTRGTTEIKNLGKILIEPNSQIIFSDLTKFRNSGQIALNTTIWEVRNKGELNNSGTIDLLDGSRLQFLDKSRFINAGKTNLNAQSQLSFIDYARFESRRMFAPKGIVTLARNSVFENLASFKQQKGSSLIIRDNAQLLNNHTFELSGETTFTGSARILNDGVFAVKKAAQVHTEQMAVMINTGTFRNEGGAFTIDNQNNFINDNIVSGHESRTQGRHRL